MPQKPVYLLLADDDFDDCHLFKEALEEYPSPTKLTIVNDGVELMGFLASKKTLPQLLFMDLNMPRKNGFDCLSELKQNQKLQHIPVIIFSTSFNREVVNLMHTGGAKYYIRKPAQYTNFKKVISKAILLTIATANIIVEKDNFVLSEI